MKRNKNFSYFKSVVRGFAGMRFTVVVLFVVSAFTCLLVPPISKTSAVLPAEQIGPVAGTLWTQAYNGPANCCEQGPKIALDATGNVYITGKSTTTREGPAGPFDDDIVTIKYNQKGMEAWVRRFGGGGYSSDVPQDIAVDAAGNVYVTGYISANDSQFVTLKYDTDGLLLWTRTAGGPLYDNAFDLFVDTTGNVYVTGRSAYRFNSFNTPIYQFLTVKYDANGTEMWQRTFETSQQEGAEAAVVTADQDGNVYVSGKGYLPAGVNLGYDIFTIKYNEDGNELWARQFTGDGPEYYNNDTAAKLRVDASGLLYVLGTTTRGPNQGDIVVLKYASNGDVLQPILPSYSDNELSTDWAFGSDGSIFVQSLKVIVNPSTYSPTLDVITYKLNETGGVAWRKVYASAGGGNDFGRGIAFDGRGRVHIGVDAQQGTTFNENYVVVSYRASDGTKDFEGSFDGPASDMDRLFAMTMDNYGSIYLTGESQADWDSGRVIDFMTLKVAITMRGL